MEFSHEGYPQLRRLTWRKEWHPADFLRARARAAVAKEGAVKAAVAMEAGGEVGVTAEVMFRRQ